MKRIIKKHFWMIFGLVLITSIFLAFFLEKPLEQLRIFFANDFFWTSSLIYFLSMILSTIFFPITIAPVIPFVSKIIGSFETFLLTFFGILFGSVISFFLSRYFKLNLVSQIFSEDRLEYLKKIIPHNLNFSNILFFRLFTPPDDFSYFMGLYSKVNFGKYILASALGLIPITFILSFGADAISGENKFLFFFLIFAILLIIFAKIYFKIIYNKNKIKIITHPYNFHLDDLFSVATIVLFMEKRKRSYKIIRTNNRKELEKYKEESRNNFGSDSIFIVDVGGEYNPDYNFFDHHQRGDIIVRDNGIPYSSFGLVWKKYGEKLCDSREVADKINFDIVLGVDANDNGLNLSKPNYDFFLYGLPSLKNSFFPLSEKKEDYDRAFLKVLSIFKEILKNEIMWAKKKLEDEERFRILYNQSEDKRVAWIEENLSLGKSFLEYPELLFLVKKKNDGWIITSVAKNNKSKEVKQKMPDSWCGLNGKELEKETGILGAIFCHNGGWIASVDSRKGAEKMIEKLLEKVKLN